MDTKTSLVALAIQCNGEFDQINNMLNNQISPSDEAYAEAEKLVSENKVITILDNDYPHSLRSAIKPPFALFIVRQDEGAPTLKDDIDYVQTKAEWWGKYEYDTMKTIESALQLAGKAICYMKDYAIHIQWPNKEPKLVLSVTPRLRPTKKTAYDSIKAAVCIGKEAYYVKVRPYSVHQAGLAFVLFKGGKYHILSNEDDDKGLEGGKVLANAMKFF